MNIDPTLATVIGIILLLILLALGMPLAFTMALSGFVGLAMLLGINGALSSLEIVPFSSVASYLLTVVPMFILMGQFAFYSGISNELFDLGQKWLSKLPGGLACAAVAGCAMFGACTGSSLACCATMGKIAIPEMERAGYDSKLAAGCVAGAGGLAILIPPSIAAVMYGAITQESIGKLLIAGIFPGILSMVIYIGMIVLSVKRSPELAPVTAGFSWKERLISLKQLWGIIVIFTLVIGSIYLGFATPTEAGAVGAFGTLAILVLRRGKTSLHEIWGACLDTIRSVSMIFTIFIGAMLFGHFVAHAGVPMKISAMITTLNLPPLLIVIVIILFYIPLGMFLDTASMVLLTTPIIYPVIIDLGFSGIWWGIIIILTCEIGLITPPVAFNIYVIKGVAPHISTEDIIKGVIPFIVRDLLIIGILIAFPKIATWLPSMM